MMLGTDTLLDLFRHLLLKGEQPQAETNLVAHLGVGVVFEDIDQPLPRMSTTYEGWLYAMRIAHPAISVGFAQTALRHSGRGRTASRLCTAMSCLCGLELVMKAGHCSRDDSRAEIRSEALLLLESNGCGSLMGSMRDLLMAKSTNILPRH